MKWFLSFSPLAFTLVPPDMTIQVARAWCLEILFGIVLIKFIASSNDKLSDFWLFCGRFSPCGSSCSVHPTLVYVHTPKKSIFQYQPFSSNITKRKQGTDVLSTKLHDTLTYTAGKNKMIWFRPSVGETCACTSVQHGATETVSTYWMHLFVLPLSAVYVSVKYRPNTEVVWPQP